MPTYKILLFLKKSGFCNTDLELSIHVYHCLKNISAMNKVYKSTYTSPHHNI